MTKQNIFKCCNHSE